jgi:branched-chain amino acid transport system substrate-binding protein
VIPGDPGRGQRLSRLVVGCALIGIALGGCSASEDSGAARGDTLAVYVSIPLHGPRGAYGRAIRDGAKLALEDAGGRAEGVEVDPVFLEDTDGRQVEARWSPRAVAENARAATSHSSAIAYAGEFDSGATRTSLPITNEARMLQVSPASTALDLVSPVPGSDEVPAVQPSGERSFGRVIPDDEAQAAAAAAWARKLELRTALVLSDRSEFGETVADEFAEEAQALGVSVERPGSVEGLKRIARQGPDLVYYGGTAGPALPLLERATRLSGATIMGTDALLLERSFLRRAGSLESGLRLTAAAQDPAQLRGEGRRFVRRYRQRFGGAPDPYAAYGYEAMAVVLDAIARAEPLDRGAVVDAFFETTDRRSVLGTYSIDELGNSTLDRLAGYRVRDGRPVFDSALRVP